MNFGYSPIYFTPQHDSLFHGNIPNIVDGPLFGCNLYNMPCNADDSSLFSSSMHTFAILYVCALVLVFVACEFGQWFSNAYVIYQVDWYLLPIQVQRLLLISMIYAQSSADLQFFDSFSLSRDIFKRVSACDKLIINQLICRRA